ncbi:gastrula zinc finger protein XlCGF67.1-like isoform X2 [Colossoma macropomum]|uniref:gastrula zinc finger protein XlCGF67.1-like isoform X2 n=1 Tax=Colossoma macropomum TaxID=42526 RepID=UPI0018642BB5|nr:gastrula zinc finger protein XlCGF67.1-like isoform X2 [Colossoma macropomum]
MSCVKEECEDISVTEASGLKTEDEEVKQERNFQDDIKEEFKQELKSFEDEYCALKSQQTGDCEENFIDSSHQKDHLRIHAGEEVFSCSQCGKSFTSERALKCDMDVHDGTRPHQCSECEKSFKLPRDSRQHKKIHTGEKTFTCSECGESLRECPPVSL